MVDSSSGSGAAASRWRLRPIVAFSAIVVDMRSTGPALAFPAAIPTTSRSSSTRTPTRTSSRRRSSAEPATVDIGNGVMANVQTFNGTIPGPEFRLEGRATR